MLGEIAIAPLRGAAAGELPWPPSGNHAVRELTHELPGLLPGQLIEHPTESARAADAAWPLNRRTDSTGSSPCVHRAPPDASPTSPPQIKH